MVNVGVHHGAVGFDLLAGLDSELLSFQSNRPMNGLPGFCPDTLDFPLQGRFVGNLSVKTERTEATVGVGIGQMEGQLLVAQARHLLEHHYTQNLLGCHAGPAFAGVDPPFTPTTQVFVNQFDRLGQLVEHGADDGKLASMVMAGSDRYERS